MATATKTGVDAIIASALKKHGLHVGSMNSVAEDVCAITTGNLAIDFIIGVGGLPIGRSIELFGPPSCGKTTTALQAAARLQKMIKAGGGTIRRGDTVVHIKSTDRIVYFDYEHAMDPEYAKALGLDIDHESFLFAQPDSLEQGVNVARALIETGDVRLIIWDSVAAMTPQVKLEAETGKSLPAVQAKLMSESLVVLNSLLHKHNCTSIFLNHIKESILHRLRHICMGHSLAVNSVHIHHRVCHDYLSAEDRSP